jgi:hypothetical protein
MIAHIRKTDALHKPWYVQYTLKCMCKEQHTWLADGFDSYGAAHAHATAMGVEIVNDQHSEPLPARPASPRFSEYMRTGEQPNDQGDEWPWQYGLLSIRPDGDRVLFKSHDNPGGCCEPCPHGAVSFDTIPSLIAGLQKILSERSIANDQAGDRVRDAVMDWQPCCMDFTDVSP